MKKTMKLKISVVTSVGACLAIGVLTVMAACTYTQSDGQTAACDRDTGVGGCEEYILPLGIHCYDAGSVTYGGSIPGTTSTTNLVDVTKYASGTCSQGHCAGGTVVWVNNQQVVDKPCASCPQG